MRFAIRYADPSRGDASVFLSLEHAVLSQVVDDAHRTRVFVGYSLAGSLAAACGSLAAGLPIWVANASGASVTVAVQFKFGHNPSFAGQLPGHNGAQRQSAASPRLALNGWVSGLVAGRGRSPRHCTWL